MNRLVAILLLLSGCSAPKPAPAARSAIAEKLQSLKPTPTVRMKPLSQPQSNRVWEIPAIYPTNNYLYVWSLESTTNFIDWTTVTNYPFGYTNGVFIDAKPGAMYFRMHGRLYE